MRQNLRIHEMDDREYKRYQTMRKRKLALKNRITIFSLVFCFFLLFAFVFRTVHSSANTGDDIKKYKYYTVITIAEDETLWEIVDEYIDLAFYKDKAAYIAEVVQINHLSDASLIRNGQKLTIPYYSMEYRF